MFFGDVALSIPKTIVDKRMADYQEMRKVADSGLYSQFYNDSNNLSNQGQLSWQQAWSDTPCHRYYYGKVASDDPVLYTDIYHNLNLYIAPLTGYWIGGAEEFQIAFEYCWWDIKDGWGTWSGRYGPDNSAARYLYFDFSVYKTPGYGGWDVGSHYIYWNYWKHKHYEQLIHATNMMNLFNKKYYENGKVIHPTDDTGFIPS